MNTVKGLAELRRKFKELPKEVQGETLKNALKEAGTVVKDAVVARAPEKSGTLKKQIKVSVSRKFSKRGSMKARISPSGKTVAHLIELGTKERVQETTGRRTGRLIKKPFFGPGFAASAGKAQQIIERRLWQAIAKKADRI